LARIIGGQAVLEMKLKIKLVWDAMEDTKVLRKQGRRFLWRFKLLGQAPWAHQEVVTHYHEWLD